MKIGIDPGHGGEDRYNIGYSGEYVEADGVLDISLHLRDELVKRGFQVVITRTSDKTLTLSQRAEILNKNKVDIALSIHTNAHPNKNVRGVETIHSIHGGRGQTLATIVFNRLANDLRIPKSRIFSRPSTNNTHLDYYGMIRKTNMPCVIVEVEFHSNTTAEVLLLDKKFRQAAAISIAKAVEEYAK